WLWLRPLASRLGGVARAPPHSQTTPLSDQAAMGQRALVGEDHRAVAGEFHQRRGALQLGALDQVALVEVALVEADRADEEPPAFLDELRVQPLGWRVFVHPDPVGVAAQA